jgi:3-methyladenine DNA glycosylase/8-oxoguanine DNA glycosylase
MLSRDKALSKQLLSYHRIPVPDFTVFRVGRPVQRPKRLTFPLIVKSLTQEASIGISQASVVESDDKLRERLCQLPGVGAKVANCVMLFAYERLRAFPIDVWIERVLREKYFPRARKLTATRLREFCDGYFGEHGGYAQQYLFHHARMTTTRRRVRK